jgi:hypothetical protein
VVPIIALFDSMGLSKNMGFWFGTHDKFSLRLQISMVLVTIYMMVMQLLKKFDKNPTRQWIGGI